MNLGQIRQELYDHFGHGMTPEDEVVRRFDQYVNSIYFKLMGRKGMGQQRFLVLPFSSVANDPFAVLPMVATKIITIQDRTNQITLDPCTLQQIRFDDPGLNSSATNPRFFCPINFQAPLAIEPSNASELFIKSTDAADTAISVTLDGILTGGYPRRISNLTNGTTGVSLDATITTWIAARKLFLSSRAKGDILLLEDSGAGTELARIPAGKTTSRYTKIQLHPKPTSVITYYADVELSLDRLEAEMDEPLVHEDFHWLLVTGAKRMQLEKDKDWGGAKLLQGEFENGYGDLLNKLKSIYSVGNQPGPRHFSHLGPNFSDIS